jgi:hypothetical protein
MNTDQKPDPVLTGLIILFTIAIILIAGCTGSPEVRQDTAVTIQAPQGEAVTAPDVITGTPAVTAARKTAAQTPASQPSATVIPSGTSDPSEQAVPGGILIDSIRDITAGDSLVVSGRTSLPVGTDLIVQVVPVIMDKGIITGDFKSVEKSAVTKVVKGSANGNQYSVTFDTADLPQADHIVFVSEINDDISGSNSAPKGVKSSILFNVIGR